MRFSVRGFTLIEMMIALAVFAFAALGLMLALQTTIDAARMSDRSAEVRNGIENRLARLSVGRLRPLANKETIGGVTFSEKVDRETVRNEENSALSGFWRLSVTAEWSDPSGGQKWDVSHLVYRKSE